VQGFREYRWHHHCRCTCMGGSYFSNHSQTMDASFPGVLNLMQDLCKFQECLCRLIKSGLPVPAAPFPSFSEGFPTFQEMHRLTA